MNPTMNPDKQRIVIAEACGWKWWNPQDGFPFEWETPDGFKGYAYPPDYLNSLDAMHEAEKTLTDKQKMDYAEFMDDFIAPCITYNQHNHWSGVFEAMHAPASLRAEVFLRTIGKWEVSK